MEFNTHEYEMSHSKQPRGWGQWAFSALRNPDSNQLVWFNGSYGEAKKFARAHYRGKTTVIYVQP